MYIYIYIYFFFFLLQPTDRQTERYCVHIHRGGAGPMANLSTVVLLTSAQRVVFAGNTRSNTKRRKRAIHLYAWLHCFVHSTTTVAELPIIRSFSQVELISLGLGQGRGINRILMLTYRSRGPGL